MITYISFCRGIKGLLIRRQAIALPASEELIHSETSVRDEAARIPCR